MARRARAAVVLALAVCCLLVATAPARRPVDLPSAARAANNAVALVDREAAAEPLPLRPVRAATDCAEAADEQATALAVPQEEDGDVAGVEASGGGASALQVRGSSEEEAAAAVEEGWAWGWPAASGKAEDDERRPWYGSDSTLIATRTPTTTRTTMVASSSGSGGWPITSSEF